MGRVIAMSPDVVGIVMRTDILTAEHSVQSRDCRIAFRCHEFMIEYG